MKITFSNHSRVKMLQRKIPKSYVAETISFPDFIARDLSGREYLYKKFAKLHLKVVVKKLKTNIIVITAHWVAKAPNE